MIGEVFKSTAGLLACGLVSFMVIKNRTVIYDAAGLTPTENVQVLKPLPAATKAVSRSTGGRVILEKNPRDGQFWTEARVNNKKINFLVDTGASSVALTLDDAKRAGIRVKSLDYNIPVNTAGGQIMAARTTLKHIKVGSIKVKDVDAFVIPEGLHVSLLGMTYLGQVGKIEVTPDKMVLKN